MDNNKKNKLLRVMLPGIAVSFALCFMLLVYAPFELYLTNQSDFWFTRSLMAQYTLAMFAAGMLLCVIAFFVAAKLGDKVMTAVIAAAVFVMLGAYIQGTFLVSGLPGMDGTEIDWSAYPAERIKSIAAWVLSAAVTAVLLWKLGREKFKKIAGYAGAVLGLMLVLSLGMLMFTTRPETRDTLEFTDINLMNVSDGENLIVVHLDSIDAGVFDEVLAQHPEYRDTFADFTHFDNTVTGYGHTKCSIPLILTGQWFIPKETSDKLGASLIEYNDYVNTELERSPLFKALEEKHYRIGIYDSSDFLLYEDIYNGRIDNMLLDDPVPSDTGWMVKSVLRMAMIKYAPWDLKGVGYLLQYNMDLFRVSSVGRDYGFYSSSNSVFYDRLKEENCINVDSADSFKYIVLNGAHVPFKYDKDMNTVENATYEQQIEASMTIAGLYIERLKEAGVYDNSVIVFLSDHGNTKSPEDRHQHTLLMIKGRGEKHEFAVNNAPISTEDLSEAFVKLMDGSLSADAFDWHEGDVRERRFYAYNWLTVTDFVEYIQYGQAGDHETLRPTGRVYG